MEAFTYFADPLHFAYLAEPGTPCDFCGSTAVAFDGVGVYGHEPVNAICPRCLKAGRLAEIGASTNEVSVQELSRLLGSESRARAVAREIERCTPALPTWQDHQWPISGSELPVFVKIACRHDFTDPDALFTAIPEELRFEHTSEWFWSMLPEAKITSIADGNYDTSFYLFRHSRGELCTWDCN
jgi:uncharacterized protein CbrC (UPF0167 family)